VNRPVRSSQSGGTPVEGDRGHKMIGPRGGSFT
jgi:hypothetical protein